jgi:serine/threonine-protein kinase
LLPEVVQNEDFRRLFKHLIKNWEPLFFLESPIDPSLLGKEKINEIRFAIPLAFWLAAPYILTELFREVLKLEPFDCAAAGDILYSLFELGSYSLAHRLMEELNNLTAKLSGPEGIELQELLDKLEPIYVCHTSSLQEAETLFFSQKSKDIGVRELRTLNYLLEFAIHSDQESAVLQITEKLGNCLLAHEDRILIDAYRIWAFLKQSNWKAAEAVFETYPLELLNQEGTFLHPLFGCYLQATEGDEIALIHFAGVIDTPFPRSWALLGHELTNKITDSPAWYTTSFLWERRRLYQQLALYYHCSHNPELEAYYRYLEREEYINSQFT